MTEFSPACESLSTRFYGDLSNIEDIRFSAGRIADGHIIGINNYSVWGLWFDAADTDTTREVLTVKGRDPMNKFALTMPFETITQLADPVRLHPVLRMMFDNPDHLRRRFGSLAFMKFPIRREAVFDLGLNQYLVSGDEESGYFAQIYDPSGKDDIDCLVREAMVEGAQLVAASSMNISGKIEIMDASSAYRFINEHGITTVMDDNRPHRHGTGSFAIIEAGLNGFTLLRESNIDNDIFSRLMYRLPYDIQPGCKPAVGEPLHGLEGHYGPELRDAILKLREWKGISRD